MNLGLKNTDSTTPTILPYIFEKDLGENLTPIEKKMLTCIPIGKKNAVSNAYLAKTLNIDTRTVGAIIKRLRLKHCDIGSNKVNGYYRFKNYAEHNEYIQRARKEREDSNRVLDAMELSPIARKYIVEKENKVKCKNQKKC